MLAPRHITKKVKGDYRLIAISDIHGHLQYLKALLRKVKYDPDFDYLVIIGDYIEKGDEVLETIKFIEQLSRYPKCYILTGNCEWALCAMMTIPELANEIPHYLQRVSANGIVRQLYDKGHYREGHCSNLAMQQEMERFLHPHLQFMMHLPTTLKFNDFLFVHAGLENKPNYKQGTLHGYLEMQHFDDIGHPYNETVIVGHIPTSNYDPRNINNDILFDWKKRIICIDGGIGVKPIAQLNALIIESHQGHISYATESYQPLPVGMILEDVHEGSHDYHKICFPDYEVIMLEEGQEFSKCRHVKSGVEMMIKNEFLYTRSSKLYCLDDYTDRFLALEKGSEVKVIGQYGKYSYVSFKGAVGWVKSQVVKVLRG
ncbi:metallophosphoesterase [Sharpea porci]|uniref:metallophosphoesterase n=1 Tax=Sharpea porci TaxID=2652286 RepID=UPI002A90EF4C|nr:metallophosphoesterase [Sharpea porci]MDY5278939.1 metallophosphoesterase [Sharpea porci]